MPLLAIAAFLSALAPDSAATAAPVPCPVRPQPMPPAIEAIGEAPVAARVISFAATPWEVPGHAWVIRISRRGTMATLEIVRLLRRSHCNVWDVEQSWQRPMPPAEFRALAEAIGPWARTPARFPLEDDPAEITVDGTGLELRVRTADGWEVTRTLNHNGRSGPRISALFRDLLRGIVPADERPAEDWRTRR